MTELDDAMKRCGASASRWSVAVEDCSSHQLNRRRKSNGFQARRASGQGSSVRHKLAGVPADRTVTVGLRLDKVEALAGFFAGMWKRARELQGLS